MSFFPARTSTMVAATTAAMAAMAAMVGANPAPNSEQTTKARSLILSAFGDAKGTFGESKPFVNALQGPVDRSAESVFCSAVVEGTLSGQPVTVVVTGTGKENSAECMQEMLNWYSPGITEVIWSGIAGFTPAVGGLVDARGQRKPGAKPVMIGDVCVSALSWNYDLAMSSVNDWQAQRSAKDRYGSSGGWWSIKRSDGKERAPGFQDVQQFIIADRTLADQVTAVSRSVTWPAMSDGVRRKIERFFKPSRIRPVTVFDTSQCGELSSDNFWHGATEDQLARTYLASLINASGYRDSEATTNNVVVASAMEATSWMGALATWNEAKKLAIPMVVVRAASNYDQVPLNRQGDPVKGPNGKPLTAIQDIRLGFKSAGADYAASTAAAPVLALFAQRGR